MKKSFMDDPKSWGKWEDPGQVPEAPTSESSGLPKPLTLADIRVGAEYVTLGRHPSDGRLYSRLWKVVGVPRPHGGIMEIDVQVTTPGGVGMPTSIFAHLYGLGRSFPYNNGYHAFHATLETVALIDGIVERQDQTAYSALTGVEVLPRYERAAGLEALLCFPARPIPLLRRNSPEGSQKLFTVEKDEFLRRFAELLRANG